MKKEIEYVVRYDDGQKINTMFCTDIYNMQDFVDTLENLGCLYVVIKVKKETEKHLNFVLRCLTDFGDLFQDKEV